MEEMEDNSMTVASDAMVEHEEGSHGGLHDGKLYSGVVIPIL